MPKLISDRKIDLRSFITDKIFERLGAYCNTEFEAIFAELDDIDERDFSSNIESLIEAHNETEIDIPFYYGGIRRTEQVQIIFSEGEKYELQLVKGKQSVIESVEESIKDKATDRSYGIVSDSDEELDSQEESEGEYYEESDRESLSSQDQQVEDIYSSVDYNQQLRSQARDYLKALLEHLQENDIGEVTSELEYIRADISEDIKKYLCEYLNEVRDVENQKFSAESISEFRRLILSDLVFDEIEETNMDGCLEQIQSRNIQSDTRAKLQGSFFDISQNLYESVIADSNFATMEENFNSAQEKGFLVLKQKTLYAVSESIRSQEMSFITESTHGEHLQLIEAEKKVSSWIKIFPEDNIVKNLIYESKNSDDQAMNVESIFSGIKAEGDKLQLEFGEKIQNQCEQDFNQKITQRNEALMRLKKFALSNNCPITLEAQLQSRWEEVQEAPTVGQELELVENLKYEMSDLGKEFSKKGKYKEPYQDIIDFNELVSAKKKEPKFHPNILLPVMLFTVAREPKGNGNKVQKTTIPVPIIINQNRFILSANTKDGVFDSSVVDTTQADLLRAQAAHAQNTSYTDIVGKEESTTFDSSTRTRWSKASPKAPDILEEHDLKLWNMVSSDSERVLLEALSETNTVKGIVDNLVKSLNKRALDPKAEISLQEGNKLKVYAVTLLMYSTNNVCEYCTKAIAGQLKDWQGGNHRGMMIKLADEINKQDLIYCHKKSIIDEESTLSPKKERAGLRSNAVVIAGQEYNNDQQYKHTVTHPDSKTYSTTDFRIKEFSDLPSFVELVKPNYQDPDVQNLPKLGAFISGTRHGTFETKVINSVERDRLNSQPGKT